MGFLTPLYIAGLLAISLPLVFHLIRRTPQGRQTFSSLMFLTPSPPRVTRRSRLDNLWLLLLRALALGLLAFAFARPFLREASRLDPSTTPVRRVAILVDTSASMQRDDLWSQAKETVDDVLREMGGGDRIGLYTFDEQLRTLSGLDDAPELEGARKAALLRTRLEDVAPTSSATNMGAALAGLADLLDAHREATADDADTRGQVILISDMQQGAQLDALQAYDWPEHVQLVAKPLQVRRPGNAGLQLLESDAAETVDYQRVRVRNSEDAGIEQFRLQWADRSGRLVGEPVSTYVPPGSSQIVKLPLPARPEHAARIQLLDDPEDYDNILHVARRDARKIPVVYLGDDAANDAKGLRYYLERALVDTPARRFELLTDEVLPGQQLQPRGTLVLVAKPLSAAQADVVRQYLEAGGYAWFVMNTADLSQTIAAVTGWQVQSDEGRWDDYGLLGQIDFRHPLFRSFADPRFSDFTKIHFWKYRKLALDEASANVVAAFDNGDPALVEAPVGRGTLLVLASSWRPADSQLARSTKFVPLVLAVVDAAVGAEPALPQYAVGSPVALSAVAAGGRSVHKPNGGVRKLPPGQETFRETDQPGLYVVEASSESSSAQTARPFQFAVNMAAAESDTAPMDLARLEQYGVRLENAPSSAVRAQRERQMRDIELEGRQKLWRWLVLAAVAVLFVETWLAGRLTRRQRDYEEAAVAA